MRLTSLFVEEHKLLSPTTSLNVPVPSEKTRASGRNKTKGGKTKARNGERTASDVNAIKNMQAIG